MKTLQRRRIDRTDLIVSTLCYGTATLGADLRGKDADACLNTFRDAGGNFLDTAHCYAFWLPAGAGSSECALGDYMRRNGKGDLVIGTKGGHPGAAGYRRTDHWLSARRIEADIDDSLGRLAVEAIDLFWLHRDDPRVPVGRIMELLNREIQRGRIRHIGASNWRVARIAEANDYAARHKLEGFVANQPEWNLARKNTPDPAPQLDAAREAPCLFLEEPDAAWHRQSGLTAIPYSATAGGYFATGGRKSAGAYDNPLSRRRLARAQALARDLHATPGQIALAWLRHQPFPVIPITGTHNRRHLREAIEAASIRLTRRQMAALTDGGGADPA
jgi:aryl-alcohol dehydrogenase-like predicted oxidoreductase